MCSIVGGTLPQEKIQAMSEALVHRGPDAHGFYKDDFLTLYHNRLSIIDLSEFANQPMQDEDLVLVYNGEIYNFLEVRQSLEKDGIQFQTQSDTEVLLKSYQKYGKDCLKHFNGDFAFCLYNKKTQKLFCARDRVGNKPFYYFFDGQDFVFASEIKAFQKIFKLEFDLQRLGDSLLFNINDHDEKTIYKGIYNLLPAHFLEYDLKDKKLYTEKYWQLYNLPDSEFFSEKKIDEKLDEFEVLFQDAVNLRLISDVPVGCLLSGGIDSSLVAYFISRSHKNVKFFHCAHKDSPEIDESEYVKILAHDLGFQVHYIHPTPDQLKQDFPNLLATQFDIFRSLSIYSQYVTLREAQKHVKVMLSGQGADELFGGYTQHCARLVLTDWFSTFKRTKLYGLKTVLKEIQQGVKLNLPPSIKLKLLKKNNFTQWHKFNTILSDYQPSWSLLLEKLQEDPRKALREETLRLNLPQLLRYEDRNAMAFGIENRTPFTDYRVIEFVHQLPTSFLYHDGHNKYFLRQLAKRYLPQEITSRLDKKGFEAPEKKWMQVLDVQGNDLFDFRLRVYRDLNDKIRT